MEKIVMEKFISLVFVLFSASIWAEDESLCHQGWIEADKGNYRQGIVLMKSCLNEGNLTKPSLAQRHRDVGLIYKMDGNLREAIKFYQKSLDLGSVNPWHDYVNIGNAWSGLLDYDKALEYYKLALKSKPGFNEAYYNRGIVFEKIGNMENAIADFKKAFKNGLRSEKLMERYIVHDIEMGEIDLPEPPVGFSWVESPLIQAAFLKPDEWFSKVTFDGIVFGFFFAKEDFEKIGDFQTGFTAFITQNILEKAGFTAKDYATTYISNVQKNGKVIGEPRERSMGPFLSLAVVLYNTDPVGGDYITHHLAVANIETETAYTIIFEAPAKDWDEAWLKGEVILKRLYMDSIM